MKTIKTCVRCKKTKDINDFKSLTDRILKTCQSCRAYTNANRKYCEHDRIKYQCKQCNGSSICEHQRRRNQCKDCNGTSICEHQRRRNDCKDCNGSSICEHQRQRAQCKDCNGASICEHLKLRNTCKICDFQGYLSNISRSRIYSALKTNKELSSKEYICCSIDTFKQHIESQFKSDMTWENYGKLWHIDHKIPLKYNNPTLEEVIERLHYTNTQPLYASENISKGNRYISNLI